MAHMERVRQLIFEALERRNQSARQLADEVGLSAATISHILTGKVIKPSTDTLRALAPALGFPEEQLFEMAGHASPDDRRRPRSRDELMAELEAVDAIEVPIYDITASADPAHSFFNEAPMDYGYLPDRGRYRKGRIKGILIRGNCLAPKINDGDWVFIDTFANDWQEKDVVLAVVDGSLHLKRLKRDGDDWVLVPDNGPGLIPVTETVFILGKYHSLWRLGF